jgi:hypothetical protein
MVMRQTKGGHRHPSERQTERHLVSARRTTPRHGIGYCRVLPAPVA